jgi:hypothetical protein
MVNPAEPAVTEIITSPRSQSVLTERASYGKNSGYEMRDKDEGATPPPRAAQKPLGAWCVRGSCVWSIGAPGVVPGVALRAPCGLASTSTAQAMAPYRATIAGGGGDGAQHWGASARGFPCVRSRLRRIGATIGARHPCESISRAPGASLTHMATDA